MGLPANKIASHRQACQPSYSKNLETGCLVGRAPIELLASHTHCKKIDDSESETASILTFVLAQLGYAQFSVMGTQPSSTVSKIR